MNRMTQCAGLFCSLVAFSSGVQAAEERGVPNLNLKRTDLSSFEIKTPDWPEVERRGDMSDGKLKRRIMFTRGDSVEANGFERAELVLEWKPGNADIAKQQQERRLIVEMIERALGITTDQTDLPNGRWIAVDTQGAIGLGGAYCDNGLTIRVSLAMAPARREFLTAQIKTILESVSCNRVKIVSAIEPAIRLQLPPGFGKLEQPRGGSAYLAADGRVVFSNSLAGNAIRNTEAFDTVMGSMFGSMPGADPKSIKTKTDLLARADSRPSALMSIDAIVNGLPKALYISALYCQQQDRTFSLIMGEGPFTRALAESIAKSMNCPATETQSHPSVREVFGSQCLRDNDLLSCSMLLQLVNTGALSVDANFLDSVKQKSCKLGSVDNC
jgi:hypothetical protein